MLNKMYKKAAGVAEYSQNYRNCTLITNASVDLP